MRFNLIAEKSAVFLIIFLLFSFFAYAEDLEILTYRDSYNKFETVQLEVTLVNGTFSSPLSVSNLNLRDSSGGLISIAKNSLKINETKYNELINMAINRDHTGIKPSNKINDSLLDFFFIQ